ncbi:alpha/beta-hydrolase [Setomelanomma holmii]|uniref:Alpha/beta-hydrolase n=1 Tax=Setomelanomma holmii TaxID=210430 RepID=A0A9P4LTQ5_9PLEO|nr:alpha/beta-hydrolase [Setomelanomma holmii]
MSSTEIPKTGTRTKLCSSIDKFLRDHDILHLGGDEDFHAERRKHLEVFGIHDIPKDQLNSIGDVEFTAIRGPHGTIPVRVFYPSSGSAARQKGESEALIYSHGGGYTVGSVDEFENGLRLLAKSSGVQYSAIIDWLQAAIALRRRDEGKKNLAAQMLLYPEARLPFDTSAASVNNSGYYLECNGIFSFADHYLPRGTPPGYQYISPGTQSLEYLKGVPPAGVYTSGFDPLRDKAGNQVEWRHYEDMTHGWLQMTAWSGESVGAVKDVAEDLKRLLYKS